MVFTSVLKLHEVTRRMIWIASGSLPLAKEEWMLCDRTHDAPCWYVQGRHAVVR